jgi:hypothetical protein
MSRPARAAGLSQFLQQTVTDSADLLSKLSKYITKACTRLAADQSGLELADDS